MNAILDRGIIRTYRPGDEHRLTSLFQLVFHRPMTPDTWMWKLKGQPSPVENVWWVEIDGEPVFQYASIPVRYRFHGHEAIVMVGADAMTDPKFRRLGLLSTVSGHAFQAWRQAGIAFTLGLPGDNWGSRTTALGWKTLFPLRWLRIPLRPFKILCQKLEAPYFSVLEALDGIPLAHWARKNRPKSGIDISRLIVADERIDSLWQLISTDYPVSVVRDRHWVNWRYLKKPGQPFQVLLASRAGTPAGYLAFRTDLSGGRSAGLVAELTVPRADMDAAQALMFNAIQQMTEQGVAMVLTLAPPGSSAYWFYRQYGFMPSRHSFRVMCVPFQDNFNYDGLNDARSWMLCGGDFDIV